MPFIGEVTRQVGYKRATGGDHGFSGDVSYLKKIMRNVAGILGDVSGSVSRLASFKRKPQGDISQSGIITRRTSLHRSVVGEFSSSGIVSRLVSYFRSTDGDLSWSGLVDWSMGAMSRAVDGIMTFSATLVRKVNYKRELIGDLDSSGDLKRKYAGSRKLTGDLSWYGTTKRIAGFIRSAYGIISWLGNLDWKSGPFQRFVSGVVSFSANLIRKASYHRELDGDLASSGIIKRKFSGFRKLAGSISWSGIVSILAEVTGIGIIIDPAIRSITRMRSTISKTVRKGLTSLSIDRDIEEK